MGAAAMTARDDYQTIAEWSVGKGSMSAAFKHERDCMMDEIDALRAERDSERFQAQVDEIDRLRSELAEIHEENTPWPITVAFTNRDLLDELSYDHDLPDYRRNQCRQSVVDFDRALSGVDVQ
jgi:hypothetical protein